MKANNDGKAAEFLARLYLRCKGYHIIAANVITGKGTNAGEIDIIARRRKLIIFAEVKKRRTIEKAAYAISARQKERIRRGAETFIARHPQYAGFQFRFGKRLVNPKSVFRVKNYNLKDINKNIPKKYKQAQERFNALFCYLCTILFFFNFKLFPY